MREQQTCYKRFVTLLIACNALMLALIVIQCVWGGWEQTGMLFLQNAFFLKNDRFADFYNVAQYAMDRNLVNDSVTNSPPLLHFCGYWINKLIAVLWPGMLENRMGSGAQFGSTAQGYALWLFIVISATAFLGIQCKKLLQVSTLRGQIIAFFAVSCSYPFLYAIDRGNYVFFVAILLAATLADYEKHPYRAAVWLGIAAALKLYPAVLGILFLRDKRWKPAAVCAGTGAGLTLLSFGFFATGASGFWVTIQDFFTKVQLYNKVGNNYGIQAVTINELMWSNSMRTPFLFGAHASHPERGLHGMLDATAWMGAVSFLVLAAVLLLCLCLPKKHDVFLLCSLMMILYPLNSGIYNLALLAVPLLYWCKREPDNFWVPVAGFVALLCKTAMQYGVVSEGVVITLHGVLSAPTLLALLGYLVWLRRAQWTQTLWGIVQAFHSKFQNRV